MFVNIDKDKLYDCFKRKIKNIYNSAIIFKGTDKKHNYMDIAISVDIETTDTDTLVFPYIYMIGINCICYATRYKQRFIEVLQYIEALSTDKEAVSIIMIHNLNYEWSFFNGYFNDVFDKIEVFATDNNKALSVTLNHLKIIDTYRLTNMSLYKLGKNYNLHHGKLKGGLDYTIYRDTETPLTSVEQEYCANDVILLNEYWQVYKKYALTKKNLFRCILTSTSITRYTIQGNVKNRLETLKLIHKINDTDDDVLKRLLLDTYTGAFVKSNLHQTRKILTNIDMYDYTSAYIGVMFYKYPMEAFKVCDVSSIHDIINDTDYSYLIDIELSEVKAKFGFSTISKHKTYKTSGAIIDNGRILQADYIHLAITNIDLKCLLMFYDIEKYRIQKVYKAKNNYLPKYLLKTIVDLYEEKRLLKADPEHDEQMLLLTKSKLNATYGCMVEKEHVIKYKYDKNTGEYFKEPHKGLQKTYLLRQWGNYVTSYNRYNLLTTIAKCEKYKKDCILYTDTDSIKILEPDEGIKDIINEENQRMDTLIKQCCDDTGIEYNKIAGIGLWDYEGHINGRFITCGSKKYLYEKDGKLHITISGINKNQFKYYCDINHLDPFEVVLKDKLVIPKTITNKCACDYVKLSDFTTIYDNQNEVKGFVKLKPVDFTFQIDTDYESLLDFFNSTSTYIDNDLR